MFLVELVHAQSGNSFVYGVFDNYELIDPTIRTYNKQHGNRNSGYFVTNIGGVNPKFYNVGFRTFHNFI